MKLLLAVVCSLVFMASGFAQPTGTTEASAEKQAPAEETPKTTKKAPVRITLPSQEAKKAAPQKTKDEKKTAAEEKKEEEPKIKGIVVPRGERGFLGVELVNGAFKITFYDTKKKPKEPDVARAALRWDPKYKVGQDRVVLNRDPDGKSLSNPRIIRPPHNFKLFITLIKDDPGPNEDPSGETHVIDFRA